MDNTCDTCNKEGQERFLCRENDCIYSIVTKTIDPVLTTMPLKKAKTVVLPNVRIHTLP